MGCFFPKPPPPGPPPVDPEMMAKVQGAGGRLDVPSASTNGGAVRLPKGIKVIVLGDSGTGKTSLLLRFVKNEFSNNITSDSIKKSITVDGQSMVMDIFDTRGQERFRTVTATFYSTAGAGLVVFDLSNEESFQSVEAWLHEIRRYTFADVPVIVVAMKSDVADKRVVTPAQIQQLADRISLPIHEASALNGSGVADVFQALGDRIREYCLVHGPEAIASSS